MAISQEERKARKNAARNLKYATNPDYAKKAKEKSDLYRKLNPEKSAITKINCYLNKIEAYKEKFKNYYLANSIQIKNTVKKYRIQNKEKIAKSAKLSREINKIAISRKRATTYKKYRSANIKRASDWAKKYPNKVRVLSNNRRARKIKAGGKLSNDIFDRLMLLQKETCICCRVNLLITKTHLDHIVPLSKGGSNDDKNVQLLCQVCNNRKHAKHPIDFMQENGYLL